MSAPGTPEGERGVRTVGAISGFLSAGLGIVTVFAIVLVPSSTASTALTVYQQNTAVYTLAAVAVGLFALVGIPFYASLARMLRPQGPSVATSAIFLAIAGLFVFAIGTILIVGFAASASSSISSATPQQQAVLSLTVGILMGDASLPLFGIVSWSVGVLLFGTLMWRSRLFPNWLSLLGIVAGALGLPAFVPAADFLVGAGLVGFSAWAFVSGAFLWGRTKGPGPA